MKLYFVVLLIAIGCKPSICQNYIAPPNMIELEITKLNFDYLRNIKTKITVSSHFVSEYIESNYQYNKFLEYLKRNNFESLLKGAQPNREICNSVDLDKRSTEYLTDNYWENEMFSDFPVLGLNLDQINNYVEWKTNLVNKANFEMKGFKVPMNSDSIIVKAKAEGGILSYRIPTFHESISMFEQASIRKVKGRKSGSQKFRNWLKRNSNYNHLVYEPDNRKIRMDEIRMKLQGIGVVSTYYSRISTLTKPFNCGVSELVFDDPRWLSNEIVQINTRSKKDIQSVVVSYDENLNREVEIIKGETPLLGFRIVATNTKSH